MQEKKYHKTFPKELYDSLSRTERVSFISDQVSMPVSKISNSIKWSSSDISSGRFKFQLYQFLTDHVPVVSACLWTWVNLASAPGQYIVTGSENKNVVTEAENLLKKLWINAYADSLGNRTGLTSLIPDLFSSLFRDGMFGGFLRLTKDGSQIDQFIPVNPSDLSIETSNNGQRLFLELNDNKIFLNRPDYYHISFNNSPSHPFGRSLLQPIPFVSYIEQQLVDDMRRSSHNSGYHRLHVSITPPERMSGESDKAFTDRINSYFDSTVKMIKSCDINDNPVTWDNVAIEYIGPNKSREVSNSWFVNHRAMIEEVCTGMNLAPFLVGYSYGATSTWAVLKFDVVMRQIRAIQQEVSKFMQWLGNIELALAGLDCQCVFEFDNSFAYQANDNLALRTGEIDNLLKLLNAGLIDKDSAIEKVRKYT